jgi:hypothetical protein
LPLRLFAAVLQLVYSIFQIRRKWKTVRFVSLVADNGISCCIGDPAVEIPFVGEIFQYQERDIFFSWFD